MNILFISSEIIPFASSGGLGDVCAALPKTLASMNKNVIRVMPLYGFINKIEHKIINANIPLNISFADMTFTGCVYKKVENNLITYFIQSDDFFERDGIYYDEFGDYNDNFQRFLFFQKSIVHLIDFLNLKIDIVHCNDWQTALIPMFLKYGVNGTPRLCKERSLMTIHNIAHQGIFGTEKFYMTQFPLLCLSPESLEFYGNINCFKGGLVECDAVNTVSPTYAKEILTPEFGNGLDGVLSKRGIKVSGILNGVDYEIWNPESDEYIKKNFNHDDLSGKKACKKSLQEEINFPINDEIPLFGMVSRLTFQKGLDLLAECMNVLMEKDIQIIFLGTGDYVYEQKIRDWSNRWPEKIKSSLEFSVEQAHRIFAGSDLFLMPSIFEPCGQSQIFSMRYGSIPIAYKTGGLIDTIIDYPRRSSTGFLFDDFSQNSFLEKINYALSIYPNKNKWEKLIKRAMQKNFSVDNMANEYIKLYKKILQD